jgi:outer membrane protein TolC
VDEKSEGKRSDATARKNLLFLAHASSALQVLLKAGIGKDSEMHRTDTQRHKAQRNMLPQTICFEQQPPWQ